jgi:hypothetical protein
MPTAKDLRNASRTEKPENPFGTPSDDETFEILIPEGAESGKIPAGDQYIGKLISVTRADSKSSGNPMLVWVFTVVDGDFQGFDFTLWTSLQSNALWKLGETLNSLGVPWKAGEPIRFKARDVLATLVRLKVKDDKRDGRELSKLDGILPHPDGAGTKGKGGFVVPKKADDEEEEAPRARRGRAEPEDEEEDTPPRRRRPVEDDEEEEERPRSKRRADLEDEEEERPRKKARGDDDEWPEPPPAPAKKARRVDPDDEEEDEPPRRKATATSGRKTSRL